jgi:Response regulator containing a CheY-like receiver domain and an HTH DNA-binding domain
MVIQGMLGADALLTRQSGDTTLPADTSRAPHREEIGKMVATAESSVVELCVVDSPELGAAYPRLNECALDVMALVPSIDQVSPSLLHEYDAVLIGCSASELEDAAFQAQVVRLVRIIPAIAVVPPGADAATAARIGFHGLVQRDVSPEALTRTVRAASQGEIAFPRAAVAGLFKLLSLIPLSLSRGDQPIALTPRQQQIVDLIAQGATDREIAAHLQISESTAHKHVQNALRRSKTKTRSQLVAVARQTALT